MPKRKTQIFTELHPDILQFGETSAGFVKPCLTHQGYLGHLSTRSPCLWNLVLWAVSLDKGSCWKPERGRAVLPWRAETQSASVGSLLEWCMWLGWLHQHPIDSLELGHPGNPALLRIPLSWGPEHQQWASTCSKLTSCVWEAAGYTFSLVRLASWGRSNKNRATMPGGPRSGVAAFTQPPHLHQTWSSS